MARETGRAYLVLPRVPRGKERKCWDDLRSELRRFNLHLTILGLRPDGRPTIKLVGPRDSLRTWLDRCDFGCVGITGD